MRLRRIILIHIILIMSASPIWAESEIDSRLAKSFVVKWDSIQYNQTLLNPEISTNRQTTRESLRLSCDIEILDPNKTLGTCQYGKITELTVGPGRQIDISRYTPDSSHMPYEGLRYNQRFIHPPGPPKWQALIRSVLRLKQPQRSLPKLVNELQPNNMSIPLDIGLLEPHSGQINSIKGYFYALMAESIEYIDIPFEPNVNWVTLTPDINIQVRKAECMTSPTSLSYNLNIAVDTPGRNSMNRIMVWDPLPKRIVIDRQLIGKNGKSLDRHRITRRLPANIGGSSSGSYSDSGGVSPIEKIRFVIAVNPTHHKIPFELKNIPLPNP